MRHHGDMAATTCIHGYAPGQCLICQTLQGAGGKDRPTKEKGRSPAGPATVAPLPTRVRPDTVVADAPPRGSFAGRAIVAFLIIAVVALVAVWAIGVAYAVLRAIELLAVALVAGWIGYRVGLYRGRHAKAGD